jgi:hypothetical protein
MKIFKIVYCNKLLPPRDVGVGVVVVVVVGGRQ